jgi:hypothetical protein
VFVFADGLSVSEGVDGAISTEGLRDKGRAPCHVLTVPWHSCSAEEGDYHNNHAYRLQEI